MNKMTHKYLFEILLPFFKKKNFDDIFMHLGLLAIEYGLLFYLYVFTRGTERGSVLSAIGLLPKSSHGWVWAGLMSGAVISIQASRMDGQSPVTCTITLRVLGSQFRVMPHLPHLRIPFCSPVSQMMLAYRHLEPGRGQYCVLV